jgi:hypothetical protein
LVGFDACEYCRQKTGATCLKPFGSYPWLLK